MFVVNVDRQVGFFHSLVKKGRNMDLDVKQMAIALRAIAEEKNLPEETVQEIVEQALAAAYKKDYGDREQEVRVSVNLHTGDVDAYVCD